VFRIYINLLEDEKHNPPLAMKIKAQQW